LAVCDAHSGSFGLLIERSFARQALELYRAAGHQAGSIGAGRACAPQLEARRLLNMAEEWGGQITKQVLSHLIILSRLVIRMLVNAKLAFPAAASCGALVMVEELVIAVVRSTGLAVLPKWSFSAVIRTVPTSWDY
jgi:hypothetical protein